MADLGAFEPLAERLRRSDGDTGSQRSTPPALGGVRPRSGSPGSQEGREERIQKIVRTYKELARV